VDRLVSHGLGNPKPARDTVSGSVLLTTVSGVSGPRINGSAEYDGIMSGLSGVSGSDQLGRTARQATAAYSVARSASAPQN
jgi:hypothetical protein